MSTLRNVAVAACALPCEFRGAGPVGLAGAGPDQPGGVPADRLTSSRGRRTATSASCSASAPTPI
ncbi:hypothetical protein ACRAWD_29140 [Caulobacter segnis]